MPRVRLAPCYAATAPKVRRARPATGIGRSDSAARRPAPLAPTTARRAAEAEQESWRPALDAYAASLALAETGPVRETYETLRTEHGFRILDYKVDSDAAAPRACFTFSEAIRPKTDYAPFVAVSGSSAAAVTAASTAG